MDIAYAVQQLDREIAFAEQALKEKKDQREKLSTALSPQEQALVDEAKSKIKVVHGPAASPAAPPGKK